MTAAACWLNWLDQAASANIAERGTPLRDNCDRPARPTGRANRRDAEFAGACSKSLQAPRSLRLCGFDFLILQRACLPDSPRMLSDRRPADLALATDRPNFTRQLSVRPGRLSNGLDKLGIYQSGAPRSPLGFQASLRRIASFTSPAWKSHARSHSAPHL